MTFEFRDLSVRSTVDIGGREIALVMDVKGMDEVVDKIVERVRRGEQECRLRVAQALIDDGVCYLPNGIKVDGEQFLDAAGYAKRLVLSQIGVYADGTYSLSYPNETLFDEWVLLADFDASGEFIGHQFV